MKKQPSSTVSSDKTKLPEFPTPPQIEPVSQATFGSGELSIDGKPAIFCLKEGIPDVKQTFEETFKKRLDGPLGSISLEINRHFNSEVQRSDSSLLTVERPL